ncbi:Exo_endo_phos domain-containing protein [Cephalotus follicularis]|uniref:Exo_endo_phos domain-containing protein n=1 Tax=Cephalotus follicularis TaxID=3775 RepID=A0A1Q3B586_CEPFO|nr:Exo_endo_phos domain-containing protein [Cephalotus follicularis]
MKCTSWTVRGLKDPCKHLEVRNFIRQNDIAILGLLESWVRNVNTNKVASGLLKGWKSVKNRHLSLLGRILLFWDPARVRFKILRKSYQVIHALHFFNDSSEFFISFGYGDCDYIARRELWWDMRRVACNFSTKPWAILGDFNVSKSVEEQLGGKPRLSKSILELEDCIWDFELEDIRQTGCFYTWNNKRSGSELISKNLDRVMGNWLWFQQVGHLQAHFHVPGIADHSP